MSKHTLLHELSLIIQTGQNLSRAVKEKLQYQFVLHLGCRALLGLGLYVSKALDAEPADLDKPDETAERVKKEKEKKEITRRELEEEEQRSFC